MLPPDLEPDTSMSVPWTTTILTHDAGGSPRNLLLRSLAKQDYALLDAHLHPVELHRHVTLVTAGAPIAQVYFLNGGVASVVARGRDGTEMEVGMVGHEGVTPIAAILGAETSTHDIHVAVGGYGAQAMSAAALRDLMRGSESLREALQRYAMTFLTQVTNTAISNGTPIEQRLARWLLMCHDRMPGDELELTHDFVATMLSIRRSSVTVTLHVLEGVGAIRSTRGLVTVLDRERLMELAGEAYGQPEAEYRKLIGPFPAKG